MHNIITLLFFLSTITLLAIIIGHHKYKFNHIVFNNKDDYDNFTLMINEKIEGDDEICNKIYIYIIEYKNK